MLFENHTAEPIPAVILFERRGIHVGYQVFGPVQNQASVSLPTLDGSPESLESMLEGLLLSEGLYADEAHAMLETWKDSWFEEGARVLYIVPRNFVDSVLPLTISPAPKELTRVFVGRLELITPTTQRAVESALARNDRTALAKYHRFLEPILRWMIASCTDESRSDRLDSYLNSAVVDSYSRPPRLTDSPSGFARLGTERVRHVQLLLPSQPRTVARAE